MDGVDAEPSRQPPARRSRAGVPMLGGMRSLSEEESAATTDAGGGSHGADRKVDDATRELVSHVGQRVEPVVGIRRRDEARLLERHQDGTSREVNTAQRVREPAGLPAKVVSRTTYSARRPTDGRLNQARTRIRVVVHARHRTSPSRWSAARTSPRSYGTTSSTTSATARRRSEMAVSRSSNP